MQKAVDQRVSWTVRWGFALAAVASMAGSQIVAVLGLRFMTDSLAMSAGLAGAIFALIRIWDGIVDPLVGYASDRTGGRFGRRLPYLWAGSIVLPLAILGMFAAPHLDSPMAVAAFITFILAVHGVGYSLIFVPIASMSVEVTDGYHERSSIVTFRTVGGFFGSLLGSTLPPWLLVTWGGDRQGHAAMALTVAALIMAAGLASVGLLRRARATVGHKLTGNLLHQARIAWSNKPFRIIVLVHVVFMIGVATAASSNAYFTRYVLNRSDAWLGAFYIFLTFGNLVAVPFWLKASRRWDKRGAYSAALILYGAAVLSWVLSGPAEPLWVLGTRVTIIGMAMSGVVLVAASILTDAVRYDYIQTGERREGAFSGFISLIDKFSSAIGLAGMGFLLSKMGYVSSAGQGFAQSETARTAVIISFSVVPAITAVIAVLLMRFYTLKEDDLLEEARTAQLD